MIHFDFTKQVLTFGEALGPAMGIKAQKEAEQYYKNYVQYLKVSYNYSNKEAENIAIKNLLYYSGYYNNETRQRIIQLFGVAYITHQQN